MMAGNPGTWWSMINNNNNHNNSIPTSFYPVFSNSQHRAVESLMVDTQEFPQSWSQLLMGVLASDEDKVDANNNPSKNLDHLEYERLSDCLRFPDVDLKPGAAVAQEFRSSSNSSLSYNSSSTTLPSSWSQIVTNNIPTWPSITSCNTNSKTKPELRIPSPELVKTSEHFNSVVNGGAPKKAKVQSSNQPSLKIRKEKLGDRINALHQIVSPFGKTDTASVLTEAIGYIRFFQDQIEALSSPYLRNQQHSVEGHIGHCVIPEDSCHLMNRSSLKGREASKQDEDGKNLRSRGLCLVPLSCTHDYIETSPNNAADHCWAATSTSLVRGFP